MRVGVRLWVKLFDDIGLLAPGEFVRTKELDEEEAHTLGLAGGLPLDGGDCLALAWLELLPKTFGKTALVSLREDIVPVLLLIFWGHDAQDQGGPVGLLARFASPDARGHACPDTGLVHPATIGLENRDHNFAQETVEPIANLLPKYLAVSKYLRRVAPLKVGLELCNGILLVLVRQLGHLLLELRQRNNDGIVGHLYGHLIGAFHPRHGGDDGLPIETVDHTVGVSEVFDLGGNPFERTITQCSRGSCHDPLLPAFVARFEGLVIGSFGWIGLGLGGFGRRGWRLGGEHVLLPQSVEVGAKVEGDRNEGGDGTLAGGRVAMEFDAVGKDAPHVQSDGTSVLVLPTSDGAADLGQIDGMLHNLAVNGNQLGMERRYWPAELGQKWDATELVHQSL